MKRYFVVDAHGYFTSNSRNSKKHLRDEEGNFCRVYDMNGWLVSQARRWGDGSITNLITGVDRDSKRDQQEAARMKEFIKQWLEEH